MSRLTIIVAATKSNGIGLKRGLPWRLPKEMKYFAQVTSNAPEGQRNAVIMGRNTWESIPRKFRPLPKRLNIVVSRTQSYDLGLQDDASVRLESNVSSALARLDTSDSETLPIRRAFIIGGASLYADTLALPPSTTSAFVDRVLLTRIVSPEFPDCDVFMPNFLGEEKSGKKTWSKAPHSALEDWVGFKVPEGIQEENDIKYEFQMWVREV